MYEFKGERMCTMVYLRCSREYVCILPLPMYFYVCTKNELMADYSYYYHLFEPHSSISTIAADLLLMIICFIEVIKENSLRLKLYHLIHTNVSVQSSESRNVAGLSNLLDSMNVDHKAKQSKSKQGMYNRSYQWLLKRKSNIPWTTTQIICKWLISQTIS